MRSSFLSGTLLALAVLVRAAAGAEAATSARVRPLSVEDALAWRTVQTQASPFTLSPDGRRLAYTFTDLRDHTELLDLSEHSDANPFGPTGSPISGGNFAMRLAVVDLTTATATELGKGWSPAWSDDGRQLAFYADDNGVERLWLWDRTSGRRREASVSQVRPSDTHFRLRWLPDNRHV